MRNRSRLLLAGIAAALVLGGSATLASATQLSLSHTEFRLAWPDLTFGTDSGYFSCEVTLLGSFHSRTLRKVVGSLIGSITSGAAGGCDNETSLTVLAETLPWPIIYNGFTGRLPDITSIQLLLPAMALQFNLFEEILCLFRTSAVEPLGTYMNVERGQITSILHSELYVIDLDGNFLCAVAGDIVWEGEAGVRTPEGELILVRLI